MLALWINPVSLWIPGVSTCWRGSPGQRVSHNAINLHAFVLGGLGTQCLTWPWCMMTVWSIVSPDLA